MILCLCKLIIPSNYLVNKTKQYVYTMNETHMARIQEALSAHNKPRNRDSIPIDFTDCYDDDTHETRRMIHSSGMECGNRRGGAELNIP